MSEGLIGDGARTTQPRSSSQPARTALIAVLAVVVPATVFAVLGVSAGEAVVTLLLMAFAASLTLLVLHRAHHTAPRPDTGPSAAEARFQALIERSTDLVVLIDADSTVRYTAPSITVLLGYGESHLVGSRLTEVLHPDDEISFLTVQETLVGGAGQSEPFTARWRHADGSWRTFESVHADLLGEPSVGAVVIDARDVTERSELEDRLSHYAFHDPLTGLANRALFRDRLDHALRRASRSGADTSRGVVAVLTGDLDDFKAVNDRLGHAAGDVLLEEVAVRLSSLAGPSITLARMGSDEFGVLVEDMAELADVEAIAEVMQQHMAEPFVGADGAPLDLGISIGIVTTCPARDGGLSADADEVLRNAEVATYVAKSRGKHRSVVFDPSMREKILGRLQLKADLGRALLRNELVVQYQPEVDLATGRIVAMEALVRWHHPTRGLVEPLEFIPMAEDTGEIVEIGRFVLRESCAHLRRLQHRHPDRRTLAVSVNLSARELDEPNLVEAVADVLESSGLDPSCLVLEITESSLVADVEAAAARLQALSALGVRLAIDDFGTGYSSLSYLEELPVHILKIDKSFVDRLGHGDEPVMVRTIAQLARALHLELIAEGIESPEQASELERLGCRLGQGFHFARPLDGHDVAQLLERVGTLDGAPELVAEVSPAG